MSTVQVSSAEIFLSVYFFLVHSFHLASYYLLLGLEPFQLASLSCSVVLFRRFHRSCRLTAKLRYENKQLALELTGEKKSATNAPSQALLFASPC